VASLIALLAGLIPINVLAEMTRVGMLVAFTIVAIAVIVLRRSAPDLPRWFKVPVYSVTAHSRDRRLLVDHQGSSICHDDGFRTLVCAALLHTRRTTNPISVWCCSADSVGSQPLRRVGAGRCTTRRSPSSRRASGSETVGRIVFLHPQTSRELVRVILDGTR